MFYIHILRYLPYEGSSPEIPGSTINLEQKPQVQAHQAAVKAIHRKTRENYFLERRLFI